MSAEQFELQIFDGKRYATIATGVRRDLEPDFEGMAPLTRRLVLSGKAWPARPAYRKPAISRAPTRSRQDIIGAYMAWAEDRELPAIHVYRDAGYPATGHKGMRFLQVDVADFLGPAPEAEQEE